MFLHAETYTDRKSFCWPWFSLYICPGRTSLAMQASRQSQEAQVWGGPVSHEEIMAGSVGLTLHQPSEAVFTAVGGTAEIACISRTPWWGGNVFSWYHKKMGRVPGLIILCATQKQTPKYSCLSNDGNYSTLKIHNVKMSDSGTYYCVLRRFSNGTTLYALDSSSLNISIHVLAPPHPPLPYTFSNMPDVSHTPLPDNSIQLTCVVSGTGHMLRVTWNISGIHHTGRMITMEDLDGTRTFLNHVSIPRDTWDRGEGLSCDVWTHSSFSVHREIPQKDKGNEGYSSTCRYLFILAPVGVLVLLLVLSAHLTWTFSPSENKELTGRSADTDTRDGIVYSCVEFNKDSREYLGSLG